MLDKISSVDTLKLHDKNVVANIVDSRTKPIMDQLTAMDKVLQEALRKSSVIREEMIIEEAEEVDQAADPPLAQIKHLRAVHPLPTDFRFPRSSAAEMWRLWVNGKPIEKLDPYHLLSGKLMRDPSDVPQFSKASKVMEAIRERVGMSWKELRRLKATDLDEKFDDVFEDVFEGGSNLSCSTLYKQLKNAKKKLNEKN